MYAEAGVPCARLARRCVRWSLGPAAFFGGIPGSVGGALTMNAGAHGGETWRHVVEVQIGEAVILISRDGKRFLLGLRPGQQFHTHRGYLAHDDLIGAPANREAVAAFLEKRDPDFSSIPGL